MRRLSPRVAPTEQADGNNQDKAKLDEQLAAVDPVDWVILQAGGREEAVKEQSCGGEINTEVERLPKMTPQPQTHIRSNDHKSENVEDDGTDGVFKMLAV